MELTTLLLSPRRIPKLGVLIRPATLLKFHGLGRSKIPPALLLLLLPSPQTRSQRPLPATHRGNRRDEAPQSQVRLRAHRPAALSRVRRPARQRCRSPCARQTLPTRAGCPWPVLADIHWPRQGQPLEPRSVSLRIDPPA